MIHYFTKNKDQSKKMKTDLRSRRLFFPLYDFINHLTTPPDWKQLVHLLYYYIIYENYEASYGRVFTT